MSEYERLKEQKYSMLDAEWERNRRTVYLRQQLLAAQAALERVTRTGEPWSLLSVLHELEFAANHLLYEFNYDGHGHERIVSAVAASKEVRAAIFAAPPSAPAEPAEHCPCGGLVVDGRCQLVGCQRYAGKPSAPATHTEDGDWWCCGIAYTKAAAKCAVCGKPAQPSAPAKCECYNLSASERAISISDAGNCYYCGKPAAPADGRK